MEFIRPTDSHSGPDQRASTNYMPACGFKVPDTSTLWEGDGETLVLVTHYNTVTIGNIRVFNTDFLGEMYVKRFEVVYVALQTTLNEGGHPNICLVAPELASMCVSRPVNDIIDPTLISSNAYFTRSTAVGAQMGTQSQRQLVYNCTGSRLPPQLRFTFNSTNGTTMMNANRTFTILIKITHQKTRTR